MALTEFYRRRVPSEVQGVVVDGLRLTSKLNVPLRNGITRSRAEAWSEDLIAKARAQTNYRLTDDAAWNLATVIVDEHERSTPEERTSIMYFQSAGIPDGGYWLRQNDRTLSHEDIVKLNVWITRICTQRNRLSAIRSMAAMDDPEALRGLPRVEQVPLVPVAARKVNSVRSLTGKSPLHSDVTTAYFASKKRSGNYRRALEQFREQCGDKEIALYAEDDCWTFRNWVDETLDEKRGQKLSGKTKNNKMSAVSSLFGYAVEKRFRNGNPMRDVRWFNKEENRKKRRRLYTKQELTALFVRGEREGEWKYWSPLLGLYAGLRITESIQLKPSDISNNFDVWHFLVRPSADQAVKGDRARVVPVHKELIRLGILKLAARAVKENREWLFADVPLVKKGPRIGRPSQNAATQFFGRYSDECGVRDPNVDFHALRGAWITHGSQQGHDLSLRMEIVGHSKGGGVHDSYIYAGASLARLKHEMDQIDFSIRPT